MYQTARASVLTLSALQPQLHYFRSEIKKKNKNSHRKRN